MEKPKVLVIDDEPLMVKSTCIALKYRGFEAFGITDAESGVQAAREHKPAIILLDIMMPGVDGWAVLQQLKENTETAGIPVVIFTAREYANGRSMAAMNGAIDYLPKPFELDDLTTILHKYALTHAGENKI